MLGIREIPKSWQRHECPLVPRNVALVRMPLMGWCVMHERRRKVDILADGYRYCPWCGGLLPERRMPAGCYALHGATAEWVADDVPDWGETLTGEGDKS